LSTLVSAYQVTQDAGTASFIAATSPQVSNMLRMTGMDEVLTGHDGAPSPERGARSLRSDTSYSPGVTGPQADAKKITWSVWHPRCLTRHEVSPDPSISVQ
jgi:hypothetical protein